MALFEDTQRGRRRVLAAVTVLAGINCLAAAGSVLTGGFPVGIAAVFGALGAALLVFAAAMLGGYTDGLTADDQMLWRLIGENQ